MKKTLRVLAFILVTVMVLSAVTGVCFADGTLKEVVIEQTDICVPEVNAYIYPINAQGEIILSAAEADTKISAFLGDETLTVNSFASANDEGCCFIVALNTSSEEIGYENLRAFKNDISKCLDKLNDNDRLILITCSGKCETVLDGTESRDAAKRIIDSISSTSGTADMNEALDEAIRISNLDRNSVPSRHVLALYDKGAFLKDDKFMLEKASKKLIENSLPLYFVCTSNNNEVQNGAYKFAKSTGGMSFKIGSSSQSSATERMATWIKSCFILKATGKSNSPVPGDRTLKIVFTKGDSNIIADRQVKITDNIPDTVAPVMLSAECEDDSHIQVLFSEAVANADDPGNYTVKAVSDGHRINVTEAVYNDSALSAKLTLEEALTNGDYTLSIANVTDTSYEENELTISGGGSTYSLTWDNGKEFPVPMKYVYIAGGALLLIILIIIIIACSRKKEKKELEKILIDDVEPEDPNTVPVINPIEIGNGLPVQLKIKMPNGLNTTINITVGEGFVIGRSSKANLKLDDETVSSQHMVLSNVEGKLVVSDNNSTNGTFINGIKIDRPHPINSGDRVHIGNTNIIINY